jgi:hypothetical protein
MSVDSWTDDLASVVRYALTTVRATAICPFHDNVTIRVGDDAAETHAYVRATKVIKSDGTSWEHEALHKEINRQLDEAADGVCPECAALGRSDESESPATVPGERKYTLGRKVKF